jgi:hypothetical protein
VRTTVSGFSCIGEVVEMPSLIGPEATACQS